MESEKQSQYKKGLWTEEEDRVLLEYVRIHGRGQWNRIPKITGLKRCGKSCRLRWLNYLSPNVKRGDFSQEEDDLIIRLHKLLGNRWSLIAGRVPGRTDNQVKNHWNTHLRKNIINNKNKLGPLLGHVQKPSSCRSSKRRHSRATTTHVAAASSSRLSQDHNNNINFNINDNNDNINIGDIDHDEKVENGGVGGGVFEEEEEEGAQYWMGSCVFSATNSSSSDSLYYYLNSDITAGDDFVEYGYPLDLVWKGF